MCIGFPMQVQSVEPGFANCRGRGESRRISTMLVGQCAAGDWLLTFLDDAREHIDALRAAEINGVLDMLDAAFSGASDTFGAPNFVLPSSMSGAELAGLANHGHSRAEPLPECSPNALPERLS